MTSGSPSLLETAWSAPAIGFWVATIDGRFVGSIDLHDTRYVTYDSRHRRRASFDTFEQAQAAVVEAL